LIGRSLTLPIIARGVAVLGIGSEVDVEAIVVIEQVVTELVTYGKALAVLMLRVVHPYYSTLVQSYEQARQVIIEVPLDDLGATPARDALDIDGRFLHILPC